MSFTPPPRCTNGKHPVAEAARFLGLDPGTAFDPPEPEPRPEEKKTRAKAEPKKDRDGKGRFLPGCKGGPGNPYARKIAALRHSLIKHLGPRELYEIIRLLVGQAMCGNIESTKVLFQYVIGKAPEAPDPDGVDVAEWRQYVENPATAEAVQKLLDTLPHEKALAFLRSMWPALLALRAEKTTGEPGASATGEPHTSEGVADSSRSRSWLADQAPTPGANGAWGESASNGQPSPKGQTKGAKAAPSQGSRPSPKGETKTATGREMPPPLPVGNPYMRKVAELRRAVVDAVNECDMETIGQMLMSRALVGHLPSTKLLFRYVLGKPTRPPDPDTLDVDEFRRLQESPVTGRAMNDALGAVPHGRAVALISAGRQDVSAVLAAGPGNQA